MFTRFVLIAALTLATAGISSLRADDKENVHDAHIKLHQALNPGGDQPSDADRTALLKAAKDDLNNLTYGWRARNIAIHAIDSALKEISNGDTEHRAAKDIRDADDAVRNIE